MRLLEAARQAGIKRFVFASSSSVYGDSEEDFKVETLPSRPLSPYAVSKLFAMNLAGGIKRNFYSVAS